MAPSNKSTGNGPEASLLPENVGKRSLNYLETLERVTTIYNKGHLMPQKNTLSLGF